MNLVAFPLNLIWPSVLPHIQDLHNRFRVHVDWTESDVYSACDQKKAVIFKSDSDGSFAVVKLKDGNQGEKVLFIWIAYIENGKREHYFNAMKKIAQDLGASRMEMESSRSGWDKDPHWKRGITRYSSEV